MSGGARTCPHGHGRMDQWLAHDHQPLADNIEERRCHAVWKCGRCYHQISRPFDCVIDAAPGAVDPMPGVVALMSPGDAASYPDPRLFGVPIEACEQVPASAVWLRTPDA